MHIIRSIRIAHFCRLGGVSTSNNLHANLVVSSAAVSASLTHAVATVQRAWSASWRATMRGSGTRGAGQSKRKQRGVESEGKKAARRQKKRARNQAAEQAAKDEYNPHTSVQTLKVFYWTAGVGAALLAIFTSANVISSTVLCGLSPCSSLGLLPRLLPLMSASTNFGRVAWQVEITTLNITASTVRSHALAEPAHASSASMISR